ncbi:intradiol ring-cleavage dioxygenase [Paracoccus sp. TK19116]|uniref:Intradiol ring-cleavage dioxygenase n=1 Tax=Paracoccus albicereus TaxID=2922394 RepID=A0ABT1MTZ7_9RHOB|nr:intradiol ring-cleavage dioxygenase [Paracoccus albicereus]MCQ0971762.1 intradiol ring-cleavage dioxygenase [Paracoccus albicereus]
MTDRRDLLRMLAAAAPATLGSGFWPAIALAQARGAGLIAANVCRLTPASTEGPYYLDPVLNRADIREDREGAAMDLALQVVTEDCRPISGARVDVWHCDAQGRYSGVAGVGGQFLRGSQFSDRTGAVRFRTIFPGWYPGRTTHVHFKVWLGQREALTGQAFFADDVADAIERADPAYRRDTNAGRIGNAADGIARRAGEGAYARVRQLPDGIDAAMVIGVAL